MPSIYDLPRDWFKEDKMDIDKLARWADKQGWFRLNDDWFLLPDGTIISISEIEDIISGE